MVSSQLHAPVALPLEKANGTHWVGSWGWAPKPVWALWRRDKSNPGRIASQPIAIPTEVSRLVIK
jgi:hypothetical protein